MSAVRDSRAAFLLLRRESMIIDEKNTDLHQIYEECKSFPYKTFDNATEAEKWGKTLLLLGETN